jgi:serine O-acetyltransferase
MARTQANLASLDPVWSTIRLEADQVARDEPLMASLVHAGILHHSSLERALSYRIAQKLASQEMSDLILREIADAAYEDEPALGIAARADILAVFERDPACHSATGCGSIGAPTWPTSSRCVRRRCSASTSTPARGWGTAS